MKKPSDRIFLGEVVLYVLSTSELERLMVVAVAIETDAALTVVWSEAVQGHSGILKVIDHFLERAWHFGERWASLRMVFG